MSFSFSPKIVTNGLVLYLDAANSLSYTPGTNWKDISGNRNDGTLVNGPTFQNNNQGIIRFDGQNDYMEVLNDSSLNSNSCTIDIWFKYTTANNDYAMLIGKHDTFDSYNGWSLYIFNNQIYVQVKTINPSSPINFSGYNITTTGWFNATLSLTSNGTGIFYVNNNIVDTKSLFSFNITNEPLRIAKSLDSFWNYFGGDISNIKIYNRVLSGSEILQNYNALKPRFGLI
jgi:hypothetical protein